MIAAAGAAIAPGPGQRLDDDTVLRMEKNVRINMDVAGHNVSYELRLFEHLKLEHVRLHEILAERKLSPLSDSFNHQ